jgi:hypothetical protein
MPGQTCVLVCKKGLLINLHCGTINHSDREGFVFDLLQQYKIQIDLGDVKMTSKYWMKREVSMKMFQWKMKISFIYWTMKYSYLCTVDYIYICRSKLLIDELKMLTYKIADKLIMF